MSMFQCVTPSIHPCITVGHCRGESYSLRPSSYSLKQLPADPRCSGMSQPRLRFGGGFSITSWRVSPMNCSSLARGRSLAAPGLPSAGKKRWSRAGQRGGSGRALCVAGGARVQQHPGETRPGAAGKAAPSSCLRSARIAFTYGFVCCWAGSFVSQECMRGMGSPRTL